MSKFKCINSILRFFCVLILVFSLTGCADNSMILTFEKNNMIVEQITLNELTEKIIDGTYTEDRFDGCRVSGSGTITNINEGIVDTKYSGSQMSRKDYRGYFITVDNMVTIKIYECNFKECSVGDRISFSDYFNGFSNGNIYLFHMILSKDKSWESYDII